MHNYRMLFTALLVMLLTSLCLAAWSQQYLTYSDAELDEILAPVALYPDPLIAQILPAATYPDQLAQAAQFVSQNGSQDIDQQDWDVSVQAIAYYPSVLNMMVDKQDWTTSLGQAYVDQPDDVMASIQRLRARARSYGYLSTNSYEQVYLDSEYIRIVPVQPEYIYVPRYDPQVVYVQRRSSANSSLISFGLGLLIGSWLDRDIDWGQHRVFYHGWNGTGWIGRSRSHVRLDNNRYVNNAYRNAPVSVDRNVRTRDVSGYRSNIRMNAGAFRLPSSGNPGPVDTIRNRNMPNVNPATAPSIPNNRRATTRSRGATVVPALPQQRSAPTVRSTIRRTVPAAPANAPSIPNTWRATTRSRGAAVVPALPQQRSAPTVRSTTRRTVPAAPTTVRPSRPAKSPPSRKSKKVTDTSKSQTDPNKQGRSGNSWRGR